MKFINAGRGKCISPFLMSVKDENLSFFICWFPFRVLKAYRGDIFNVNSLA